VNLDLPNTAADYVHRIGRTGRAGASGQAWSFVCAEELQNLKDIETLIQKLLPRETLEGFEPQQSVPETTLSKPKKPKKPKKAKVPGNTTAKGQSNSSAGASKANTKAQRSKPKRRNHNTSTKRVENTNRNPNRSGNKNSTMKANASRATAQ
jgi:ATP-dependent RNA helicase RhlE